MTPGHDTKLPDEPPEFTLADLASGYLAHLEASGKSQGTVFSYRLELATAMSELGKDTAVRELTAERVKAFFDSDRVTKTRSGRTKSPLSIAKTTRVLRQAIAWGTERASWTRGGFQLPDPARRADTGRRLSRRRACR